VTDAKRKLEPPLKLNMGFGEALSRFVATRPAEVEDSIGRSKAKKPPGDAPSRRPARQRRERSALDRKCKPETD
jgi:hypothetical protein